MSHPSTSLGHLPPLDWRQVRPIYKKLSDEFHILTTPYGISLSERRKKMLDHLILSIDAVDQYVDEMPAKKDRDELTESIKNSLRDTTSAWDHPLASIELAHHISILKQIVEELGIQSRFAKAAARIFYYTETKRHTTNYQELIRLVKKEGYATAELPLSIMGIDPSHPFALFFRTLCMLMGIADLVIDAYSDHRANYIKVRPSPHLYITLIGITIKEGLGLIWRFPAKLSFMMYCIRFSAALMFAKK